MGKWTKETAVACLLRNNIPCAGGMINLKRAGIKVWGAIDYLVNVHGFSYLKEERKDERHR